MTVIENVIGKEMSMEVASSVNLNITVLDEKNVQYQFVGIDDGTKDAPVIRQLEIVHDDIEGVKDYSFTDIIGGRFFLFQFA